MTSKSDTGNNTRVLCLHGFRTSGAILRMQMASLRYHVADFVSFEYIDGTFKASGPIDPAVLAVYRDMDYFEWHKLGDEGIGMAEESTDRLVMFIEEHGPFVGLMGFSQGAAMATRVVMKLRDIDKSTIKFVLIVGGVPPRDIERNVDISCGSFVPLEIPSLHIIGDGDPFKTFSLKLFKEWYSEASRSIMSHNEAHNIPSLRTGRYPALCEWLQQALAIA